MTHFVSKLFFWSEFCMVLKRWKNPQLYTEDDFHTPPNYGSQKLGDKLEVAWMGEENFKKTPSLIRAIVTVFGLEFLLYGILYFPVQICVAILQPYLLAQILNFFSKNNKSLGLAYTCAVLLIVLLFVNTLCYNAFNMGLMTLGMKIRIACSSLIYRRSLRLKENTFRKVKVGQIVNLLSNDVRRFDMALPLLHFIWIGPLELVIVTSYLMMTLGSTALPGIIILCLTILLQLLLSKDIANRRKSVAANSDKRICLMNDIITNIKIIKINNWEEPFSNLITKTRNLELAEIKRANLLRFVNSNFKFFLTEMCSYFCMMAAVSKGVKLSSEFVFVLRSIYDIIKVPLVTNLPDALIHLAEVQISITRLQEFLTLESEDRVVTDNIANSCVLKSLIFFKTQPPSVSATNVTIECEHTLRDVNFTVDCGEFVGITGNPNCGKTALLQAIVKEVEFEGELIVNGVISYASQEPWIFPSTIKQNILFGEDLDDVKYKRVLSLCCLDHDLSLLPLGDDTLVGERGVVLTCGQTARVHLARAVYRSADIYLFDNPLAAVETTIAKKIFFAVKTYLKDKCVLMVTHQTFCLQSMTKVLYIKKERLVVIKNQNNFEDHWNNAYVRETTRFNLPKKQRYHHHNTGRVLKNYSNFGGGKLLVTKILLMLLLVQFFVSISDCFVTFWVNLEEQPWAFAKVKSFFTTSRSLQIYTLLLGLLMLATALSTWLFLKFATNASAQLHDSISSRVLHGTMTFFSTHSSGQILNRFSKELGEVDESMPVSFKNALEMCLNIGATGVIISVLNYYMIVPTLFLFFICIFYYHVFNNQSLANLNVISQSPIYTHVSATIQGISTIRSFKVRKMLQEEFDKHQDVHTSGFHTSNSINVAFNFWSDLTRVAYTGLTILSFFFVKSLVGDVGLAVTQALQFGVIQEAVMAWNDLTNSVVSIERVIEYSSIPAEPQTKRVKSDWPTSGSVSFERVSLGGQATFSVKSGEKIGVVGTNTSSLISVLYRLFNFEGTVVIDSENIKTLPLSLLRSNIFLIPSKPLLFPGTLRQNLDPFQEFSDLNIFDALRIVNLEEVVRSLPHNLNTETESCYFSMSQKRLLCLVRAVLKDAKIIILDKTSLDGAKLNRKLQNVLRRKFKFCTVFSIAYNLKCVMKCDKVLVLNDEVKVGSPEEIKQGFL